MEKKYSETIVAKEENQELDDAGMPIYEDHIEMEINTNQLYALHKLIQGLILDLQVIPQIEHPGCIHLLDLMAKEEDEVSIRGIITLPINYMIGLHKTLAYADALNVKKAKGYEKYEKVMDKIRKRSGIAVDAYLKIKEKESPSQIESPLLLSQDKN